MTEILVDDKRVEKLEFHITGEDGEFLWLHFVTEDGETRDTYYFKGEC